MHRFLLSKTARLNKIQKRASLLRWSSNATTAGEKPVSPHVGFYRTFTRPVAKVLLMATLSYQMAYWLWVKLEKDEIKAEREAEITTLEQKLNELVKSKKP